MQLDLSNNKLEYINENAFEYNEKLDYLFLQNNMIKSFNENYILYHLKHFRFLNMNNNSGFSLENKIKGNKLTNFMCEKCNISEISDAAFFMVIEIDLSYNNIVSLKTPGNFENINTIYRLNINNNPINNTGMEMTHNENLKILMCDNCKLNSITQFTFSGFGNIEKLWLRNNLIENIHETAFDNNKNLIEIYLEYNKLQSVSPYIIINTIPKLNTLCLDYNNFSSNYNNTLLKKAYKMVGGHLASLRIKCSTPKKDFFEEKLIDIDTADMVTVLMEITNKYIQNITVHLENQNIYYLSPNLLRSHPNQTILYLQDNINLKFKKNEIFLWHKYLSEINFSNCNITTIFSETFSKLPNLIKIDLSKNKIINLHLRTFTHNLRLKEINLNHNHLTNLYYPSVDMLKNLQILKLNSNREFYLEMNKIFLYNINLQVFECIHCNITEISVDSFSRTINLKSLILDNNSINSIDSLNNLKNLQYLSINNCPINYINCSFLNNLSSLQEICIDLQLNVNDDATCHHTNYKHIINNNGKRCYQRRIIKSAALIQQNISNKIGVRNKINNYSLLFSMIMLTLSCICCK